MNIAEAKRHVRDTVEAYMAKNEDGTPLIEPEQQRPLFLIGAPGIGKTAIMSQVASELGVGLVSYSMTHHTRQSALGLPLITHCEFEGAEYDASEYTMSEIIASIYAYMKTTGLREGILFLDEINCVSETLYPSMLQFLQFKTFGRHAVPEGWIVVCAGNPPEYNKSVHEFDIVTMDRLRKLEVEPDLNAWKAYAQNAGVHPAVLSFLDIKKECFYCVESTPSGKTFVTARGWDDLSRIITLFETLAKPVDLSLVEQFVQNAPIAEAFSLYYDLFNKYRSDYQVDKILAGSATEEIFERAKAAGFDERLALLSLILDAVSAETGDVLANEEVLSDVRDVLRTAKAPLTTGGNASELLSEAIARSQAAEKKLKDSKAGSAAQMRRARQGAKHLKALEHACVLAEKTEGQAAFDVIHYEYRGLVGEFEVAVAACREHLENAFAFIERAFEDEREMLVFVTELTARRSTALFIGRFGCSGYERNSQDIQLDKQQQDLLERIKEVKSASAEDGKRQRLEAELPESLSDPELKEHYVNQNWEYGYASLCHMALPEDLRGKTVLDIGCRRGKGLFKVSERVGAEGRAIGLDWTPAHIKEASSRMERAARETGLPKNNMEFYLAYPEDLVSVGVGGNTVDTVFVNSVLHLTCKPEQVLSEIFRVLKPGGEAIFEVALADAPRDAAVVEEARKLGNSIQAAPYEQEFKQTLADVGFSRLECEQENPVDKRQGFKEGHQVPVAPSDESVGYRATVIHAYK